MGLPLPAPGGDLGSQRELCGGKSDAGMSYPGGKGASGAIQQIINQQPPHRVYIEAFLGGGAVMRAKRPASVNFGFDLDSAAIDNFNDVAGGIANLAVVDAIQWLESPPFSLRADTLVYCDPPYLLATRAHQRIYRCELTDLQHRRFLRVVRSLNCMVQISGYYSSLYAEMLGDWRLVTFQVATRGTPITGKMATECLWMNYPAPAALHDYRYLGGNFRERERIKRKTSRWLCRVNRLPQLERLALLSALSAAPAPIAQNGGPGSRAENSDGARCDRTSENTAVLQ